MPAPWTVLESRCIHERHPHRLRLDRCRTPGGVEVIDYIVREAADIAMVFALSPAREVVLVRQYRHGVAEQSLEVPQGLLDPGETPPQAARRELLEETGYEVAALTPLGRLFASPASQTSHLHVFLGSDARDTRCRAPEPEEEIDVELVGLSELRGLIRSGAIRAASSVAGILLALDALEAPGLAAAPGT